ncbi:MAG: hypothetical protein EZS28_018973 [Streblomastix strix]|uniref:Uncharacterized protein n=1 Tax=Streblomastix strix TaxID=222440 RepID=A0A5J4VSU1_9EUKA|nr:MAG: hypothetical protein EZS28_018973 [Streblomastix strix]
MRPESEEFNQCCCYNGKAGTPYLFNPQFAIQGEIETNQADYAEDADEVFNGNPDLADTQDGCVCQLGMSGERGMLLSEEEKIARLTVVHFIIIITTVAVTFEQAANLETAIFLILWEVNN